MQPFSSPLERLGDVPWAELGHAYGSAADVPDLILALRSQDADARARARWHLYGNIFHQGTRYSGRRGTATRGPGRCGRSG
ncbi:hypothetical protein AB0J72_54620 [Dactylosporangium sp. NPDC049742]|uniref:hypothetical protein n=1 Tax=Dactylosporangium sp. NPDC049742 TaxID=3154737 RepID=UPI00342AF574